MFVFTPDGSQIVAITSPDPNTVAFKRAFLYIYNPSSGELIKEIEGKDSHTVLMCYHASIYQSSAGLELIWTTLMQVNFWNLETGEERTTLKQVKNSLRTSEF